MKNNEKVATLTAEEIKKEMARIKPLLDYGWDEIRKRYDEDEYLEQEYNYNYHEGYCSPLVENTLRMDRRYNHLKDCLEKMENQHV